MAVIESPARPPGHWSAGWRTLKQVLQAPFTRWRRPDRSAVDTEMLAQLQTLH